jgi:predicted nuclease of predicted toxin-antitoxin system
MKLLFDQNLSFNLCRKLADKYPNSTHVGMIGLAKADDRTVWNYAGANGFALVSLDADFAEMAALLGAPPKVIWLRCGNQSTAIIEACCVITWKQSQRSDRISRHAWKSTERSKS